jgi:hypothetical protein
LHHTAAHEPERYSYDPTSPLDLVSARMTAAVELTVLSTAPLSAVLFFGPRVS